MALAYLLDPQLQISDKSGALNVAGFLRVYLNGTDDRATTYKDFNGTLNPADIVLDNNGRAVVIADSSKAYRLEVYTRDGDLLWTQYPLNTLVGGAGGASGLVIESSDGSVIVDRYSEGNIIHYDLSTDVSDSTELLDWIKCSGNTLVPTNIYRPTYVDGTMAIGDYGVMLSANQYYHVTIHIDCTKVNTGAFPWTDDVRVRFRGRDILTGEFVDYQTDKVNVDYSLMLPETKELSLDVMPVSDVELVVVIDDAEITGAGFSIKDMQVHRVYSGAPHLPHNLLNGIATKPWVEDNFQETLIPGSGITIRDNVISATGGAAGNVDVFAIDSMYVEYSTGATIITGESWSAFRSRIDGDISTGKPMMLVFTSVSHHVDGSNAVYYGAMNGTNDWEYTFTTGPNKWGSGTESKTYVIAKYNDDYSDDRMTIEVKSLEVQPKLTAGSNVTISGNQISVDLSNYVTDSDLSTELGNYQPKLTAGSNISIDASTNTISASQPDISGKADKVSGATNGDLASLDSNGNLVDSGVAASSVATTTDLAGYQPKLTAGSNITIDASTQTISATDTTYNFSTGLNNNSGTVTVDTSVIQPKLTAGSNITIDSQTNTISASQPDISGKADKVTGATNGHIAGLDSNGNLTDSGIAATDVATTTDLSGKQDVLTAGSNVSISNNVISATDTTYSAGNMLALVNGAFGVSTSAGITDIQYVNALPANPVATVLYLIPET